MWFDPLNESSTRATKAQENYTIPLALEIPFHEIRKPPELRTQNSVTQRPKIKGKFLFVGNEKFWIKGVTYGTFRPSDDGHQFPDAKTVVRDFACMASYGINTVRTYTTPPRWLLDVAQRNGLRVMVGLTWEQHVTFLDDKNLIETIKDRVRDAVKSCINHPAVLCFTIGNEIPPSIVRWHGRHKIERFLKKLYGIVKTEDPTALCTYVSFPTTEYLQLPFLDFFCFNVYLERKPELEVYILRLQNLCGEKPLVMAEIGLDSRRNGEELQAESLDWQIRTAFAAGCAGVFAFAWTDEWYRGGFDIEDWDFGLTTRDRQTKPALLTVSRAFNDAPFKVDADWPRISVIVCTYNGSSTIRDTLEHLEQLAYPDYEVIVVNDGSTDRAAVIAAEYDVHLIVTENRGLSNARNIGWQQATGEIVAYIDDDAYPDPHWLHYLAYTFKSTSYVGVGGPNIAPPNDGLIADCVTHAPGGPVHVLLNDTEAEHIPGCNMAFYRETLKALGGFDPRFKIAGDDVDICWRIQEQGYQIGFHPAAMDWHHRRNSIGMYWKQQKGYGEAEALLVEKWPYRYNAAGHYKWSGQLYGKGLTKSLFASRPKIYHGSQGSALFQSLYGPPAGFWSSLSLLPEWWLLVVGLGFFSLLGLEWNRLLIFVPLFLFALSIPIAQSILSAMVVNFGVHHRNLKDQIKLKSITTLLHLIQPVARLYGRIQHGLTLWRARARHGLAWPKSSKLFVWREHWEDPLLILRNISQHIGDVAIGGDHDNWDLEVRVGLLGRTRIQMAIEEHEAGKQMFKFRLWPRLKKYYVLALFVMVTLTLLAFVNSALVSGCVLAAGTIMLLLRGIYESSASMANAVTAIKSTEEQKVKVFPSPFELSSIQQDDLE